MLYNKGFYLSKKIDGPTQEEIYSMPEYFALSCEEVFADPQCPDFLKRILDQFPWDGRHSVLQIRPQDFRKGQPDLLGNTWHTDIMVRLNDGTTRIAKNIEEFHLMVCSWGEVANTEFMTTQIEMPDVFADGYSPMEVYKKACATEQKNPKGIAEAKSGELYEYTSADIHRMGKPKQFGRLRLMIVAFDCDQVPSGGLILPSIKDKDSGKTCPKFSEYVR